MTTSLKTPYAFILIALIFNLFYSCGKINTDETSDNTTTKYYTERQEKAFEVLQGKFIYRLEYVENIWHQYIFKEHYKVPLKGVYKDGDECTIHGELKVNYYDGSSFDKYYRVGADATTLTTYGKGSNYFGDYYYVSDIFDLEIIDANTFRIKENGSYIWTTFKRQTN